MADLADICAQLRQDRSSRSERLAALRQQVRWPDGIVGLSDTEAVPYQLAWVAIHQAACTLMKAVEQH